MGHMKSCAIISGNVAMHFHRLMLLMIVMLLLIVESQSKYMSRFSSQKIRVGTLQLKTRAYNRTITRNEIRQSSTSYVPLCVDGRVTVVISNDNRNHRGLKLNSYSDVMQSEVTCKGDPPPTCRENTSPPQSCRELNSVCPCERDTSKIAAGWGAFHRMMAETLPRCKAAGNDPHRDLQTDPFRFLLIGLGGGVLPMHALAHCPRGTQFETVELDPQVVNAAKEFLGYRLIEGVNTVEVNDCALAIEKRLKQTVKYDVVLVDAFGPEGVPETCQGSKFIQGIKGVLRPGSGRAMQHADHLTGQYRTMLSEYKDVFGAQKTDGFVSFGGSVIMADV